MFYYIKETPVNLFFNLIPKNASSSILTALINYKSFNVPDSGYENVYSLVSQKNLMLNENPALAKILSQNNSFKVTALRDPYKRTVSTFLNKILNPDQRFFKVFFNRYTEDKDLLNKNPAFYFDRYIEMLSEFKNLSDLDGHAQDQHSLLEICGQSSNYDLALNVDTLFKDWQKVQALYPKMPNLPKQKINSSSINSFLEFLDFKNFKEIESIYQKDYEVLSYYNIPTITPGRL
jgi:hypothetical protein